MWLVYVLMYVNGRLDLLGGSGFWYTHCFSLLFGPNLCVNILSKTSGLHNHLEDLLPPRPFPKCCSMSLLQQTLLSFHISFKVWAGER